MLQFRLQTWQLNISGELAWELSRLTRGKICLLQGRTICKTPAFLVQLVTRHGASPHRNAYGFSSCPQYETWKYLCSTTAVFLSQNFFFFFFFSELLNIMFFSSFSMEMSFALGSQNILWN